MKLLGSVCRHLCRPRAHVVNSEAAFPTAQLVAAMRAKDAMSPSPCIGSNIGGAPDTAAEALAGDLGFAFLKDTGWDHSSLVNRTMFFDEKWMEALDLGCKQFVILAAGLDARAWRMPRLDKSIKVFEVDVPRAMNYKSSQISTLGLECFCARIVVEADLSDPSWQHKLTSSGFQTSELSFFLIEGLLMYLPPGAPEELLRTVSGLMHPGSRISGDSMVGSFGMIASQVNQVLAKYGTKFTFEFRSSDDILALFEEASLQNVNLQDVYLAPAMVPSGDKARAHANKIANVLKTIASWPDPAKRGIHATVVSKGADGAKTVIQQMVDDKLNLQGLRDESAEHKASVCELLFADGCHSDFESKVKALQLDDKSAFTKVCEGARFYYTLFKMSRVRRPSRSSNGYVLYEATKA